MASIYVGNCSDDVTEEQLRELFFAYGEVDSVKLITDRDTARPRGFAFVEMPDASEDFGETPRSGTAKAIGFKASSEDRIRYYTWDVHKSSGELM